MTEPRSPGAVINDAFMRVVELAVALDPIAQDVGSYILTALAAEGYTICRGDGDLTQYYDPEEFGYPDDSLARGLEQMNRGEVTSRGSFAQYADDDVEDSDD